MVTTFIHEGATREKTKTSELADGQIGNPCVLWSNGSKIETSVDACAPVAPTLDIN